MFIAKNKVRVHDTDMAGILYFPRIYRFANDALEDFMSAENFDFEHVFHKDKFIFVIVHSEADYYASLRVGDNLNVHVSVEKIGTTSFTLIFEIYREDHTHMGTVKTIHVSIDRTVHKKIPIPAGLRKSLEKHLVTDIAPSGDY